MCGELSELNNSEKMSSAANPQNDDSIPPPAASAADADDADDETSAASTAFFEQAMSKRRIYTQATALDRSRIAANRERMAGAERGDDVVDAFVREHMASVEREDALRRGGREGGGSEVEEKAEEGVSNLTISDGDAGKPEQQQQQQQQKGGDKSDN